uniref:long-chain-fatty-acid--CoA ligase n=2 Tax=Mastacembelus armatus TaxID=205130 RepID=A0A3Q3RHM9_9TELE
RNEGGDLLRGALCKMYVWFTLLAGLAVLSFSFLKTVFPYFGEDCTYILRTIKLGARLFKYKKVKPFYSIVDCFLDAVQRQPNKIFLRFEGREYSYSDVDKESNKVARALRAEARLKEGDTVALFLPNEPNVVWIWLGLAKLGCPAALLNFNIRSKSLLHCFSCCGAKVIVTSPELQDAIEEVLPTLREQGTSVYLLSESCSIQGIDTLSDKISKASDQPLSSDLRANVNIRSTALYIYTSGTTGLPKAAVIIHERMWAAAFIQAACGVTADDIIYINLPLYHSAGFLIGMVGAIERGITIILRRKFSASQFWDDCRKYNVTVMQYIGETMRYLCNTPKKDNEKNHRVRIAIGNGVRTDVWSEFLSRFGDIKVRELYAATEGNIGFINYTSKIGVVGRVNFVHKFFFPYTLIKFDIEKEEPVRNSQGLCIEAARGETGLLVGRITQRSPFIGYAGNQQQTEKKRLRDVLKKGDLYFNTGDLLQFDHENFVYFQDRVGDTFRWKGENVATSEVADILTMALCIFEANVYGVKVEGHEGRIGMAAVTLKEGKDFDCSDTYKQVVSYLPAYARPRFIRIQPCLEMTGTFKMKKVKLVEEGFNPAEIKDPLFFLSPEKKTYIPLTEEIYRAILSSEIKL